MKKVNVYILLFLFLFTFFYLNELLCNYWITLEAVNAYNNTPYNKNAIVFIISSQNSDAIDFSALKHNNYLKDCALLKYNDGNYKLNEVIYCDNDIIEINGIKELDFNSTKKIAVAGISSGYSVGSNIFQNGNSYPICGLLTKHISGAVNTGIFYSNNDLSHVPTESPYVLTAKHSEKIAMAYAKLKNLAETQNAILKKVEIRNPKFSDYVDYEETVHILLVVLLTFYIFLIYLFRYIWLKIKSPEIFVLNILGSPSIKFKMQKEFFSLWFFAYLSSITLFFIVLQDKCYDYKTIVSFATCILIIALVSMLGIYRDKKFTL